MFEKHSLVRTIYLYLFALVGLALLIIGCVRFVDMALKAYVFTKADEEQRIYYKQPPYPAIRLEKIAEVDDDENVSKKEGEVILSEDDKALVDQWILEYNDWKETSEKIDPVVSRRHRDASLNLSMILIGLPLYLYHWFVIRREVLARAKEEKSAA